MRGPCFRRWSASGRSRPRRRTVPWSAPPANNEDDDWLSTMFGFRADCDDDYKKVSKTAETATICGWWPNLFRIDFQHEWHVCCFGLLFGGWWLELAVDWMIMNFADSVAPFIRVRRFRSTGQKKYVVLVQQIVLVHLHVLPEHLHHWSVHLHIFTHI